MGEHDPTGELGKMGEIVPDISDPDANLSDEQRQEMVSFNLHVTACFPFLKSNSGAQIVMET